MMVNFYSGGEKKAKDTTRRILDLYANRVGKDAWSTCITKEGLLTVRTILKKHATKNMAVSCWWVRSRKLNELQWIVGNRNKFNENGIVPVNSTEKSILHSEWENLWQFMPFMQALTATSALLHDGGKGSDYFQAKLRDGRRTMDPLRHEWISCLLLEGLVSLSGDFQNDEPWLRLLATNTWDAEALLEKVQENASKTKLQTLPPLASMIAWLIVSHHKLPDLKGKVKNRYKHDCKDSFQSIWHSIDAKWGYERDAFPKEPLSVEALGVNAKELADCLTFSHGLMKEADIWQKLMTKWSKRLLRESETIKSIIPQGKNIMEVPALRMILSISRLALMMADHYVSSLPKDMTSKEASKWSIKDLWANTDRGIKSKQKASKQYLEEHLVKVCRQAVQILYRLPDFAMEMERAYDIHGLEKKSPKPFAWQDKAVDKIKEYRKGRKDNGAWFIVNMASTGCGKTIANAKLMQAISDDGDSLRYSLVLGLRSLTLQTGDSYRQQLGLDETELAVLIGSNAVKELHEKASNEDCGSESAEELMREDVEFVDTVDDKKNAFMSIFIGTGNSSSDKNKALLYKPVLVTTIDHMMGAVQTVKGGRYMLPLLRMLSSDLVIDEIDDFALKDLYAIARLVHLAGMLGRSVAISSATIPPDLAEGLYRAYLEGLSIYNDFFSEKKSCGAVWCDEFKTLVAEMDLSGVSGFREQHQKFVAGRIKKLEQQQVRRKGILVPCGTEEDNPDKKEVEERYFETIREEAEKLHKENYIVDKKTGKHISFGIIRMANIGPCVSLSLYLLRCPWSSDYTVRLMTYHSRQILILRHEQERYLDAVLKRKYKKGEPVDLTDPVIRKHIDEAVTDNVMFLVVSTPVEETGRDHDFDWAIIEPSSYRSIIQLSGRVLRHRIMDRDIKKPNVAVMNYNLRGLLGEEQAFKWPGFETGNRPSGDEEPYLLNTHEMDELVNAKGLARSIDAIPRIKKAKELCPKDRLIDLEQLVMEDFNSFDAHGPAVLQGWLNEYWWLTGLPLEFNRFREQTTENLSLWVLLKKGQKAFCELIDGEFIEKQKLLGIELYDLSEEDSDRLWIHRDYKEAMKHVSNGEDVEDNMVKSRMYRFGELVIPKPNNLYSAHWWYSDQLGLFKQ